MRRRTLVRASEFSDIFAGRFRDLHPLTRVTGVQYGKVDREWLPLGFVGPMDQSAIHDANAILTAMRAEYRIDE